MISFNPSLHKLFEDIDRTKVRVWALTNAYRPVRTKLDITSFIIQLLPKHAERVLRILNLRDLIDGLVFCDYAEPNFSCKPEPEYYNQVPLNPLFTFPR